MRISILLPRILRLVGDYETSSGILEETRSFVKSMGARRYWRRFLYESGMSALAVTDLDKARADLEECLEISERVGLAAEFAESACAVGFLDHLGRDHSSAMYYYGLALEAGSQWTRCRCLTRMGILNLESDSLDSAEEHFVKAISACAELLEKSPRLYDIAYNLAFARLGLGESEAIKTFENAVELCCTPGVRDEVLGELQLFRRSKRPIDCLDEATGLLESRS